MCYNYILPKAYSMKAKIPAYLCILVICFLTIIPLKLFSFEPYKDYNVLLNDFSSAVKFNNQKTFDIQGYIIDFDSGNLSLENGSMLTNTINHRKCMFFFQGSGSFSFSSMVATEKSQLKRFFNTERFYDEIEWAFGCVGDSSIYSIEKDFTTTANQLAISSSIANTISNLSTTFKNDYFINNISKTLLEGFCNKALYLIFKTKNHGILMYCYDPYDFEEVKLLKCDWYAGIRDFSSDVCQAHRNNYVVNSDTLNDWKRDLFVTKTTVKMNINSSYNVSAADVSLNATIENDTAHWFDFRLYYKLKIDSIIVNHSIKLNTFQFNERNQLYAYSPITFKKGENVVFEFYYQGQIISTAYGLLFLEDDYFWIPLYRDHLPSIYDVTISYPSNRKMIADGKLISSDTKDGVTTSHWISEINTHNFICNIGDFKKYSSKSKDDIAFDLYYESTLYKNEVADEIKQSLDYFTHLFGKPIGNSFVFSEAPIEKRLTSSKLLEIPYNYLQDGFGKGIEQRSLSDIVAQLWWTSDIESKTYKDDWIQCALVIYSKLLYIQNILKNPDLFFYNLSETKKTVLHDRGNYLKNNMKYGILALGDRNETYLTPGLGDATTYGKSIFVIHMLRNLLIDFKTMDETPFLTILKEFYNRNRGKKYDTDSLKSLLEEKTGVDFSWFFNQWVNNPEIPKYTCSYKVEKTEKGYIVKCKIKQSEVPDSFQMLVPVTLDFGKHRRYTTRFLVDSKNSEFAFPPCDKEPEKVIFNDYESVLCEVEETSWNSNN